VNDDTWVYTTCGDALLIDWLKLRDHECQERTWGSDNHVAWCLSTDKNDHNNLGNGYTGPDRCFKTLVFKPNGGVYYYHDDNWIPNGHPGRRSLEDVQVEAVQACEQDESRDSSECEGLVDEILQYDQAHEENLRVLYEPPTESLAVTEFDQVDTADVLVYAFAALGLCVVLYGATKHYSGSKTAGDSVTLQQTAPKFTALKAQDEL